jgi:predicted transcriptional regulator
VVPWTEFTRDFIGLDLRLNNELCHLCETHGDKMMDLRPYLVENPEICTRFDFLPKILKRFRHMNLRHLIVVNPLNNNVEGIITRQDIFTWMPL